MSLHTVHARRSFDRVGLLRTFTLTTMHRLVFPVSFLGELLRRGYPSDYHTNRTLQYLLYRSIGLSSPM